MVGDMREVARPALAYALCVFAVGFLAGTIRVLLLVPALGETAAVLVELPVMLAASLLVARWAVARWQVPARPTPRIAVGLVAFGILMACEALVAVALFGTAPGAHFAHYLTPRAWPGLSGQLVFAAIPSLLLLRPDRHRP